MRRQLIVSGLTVLIAAATPMLAQAQQDVGGTRAQQDDGGTNGEWGLLGLLGLAGLAGLRRHRHDDVTHRPTHAATR